MSKTLNSPTNFSCFLLSFFLANPVLMAQEAPKGPAFDGKTKSSSQLFLDSKKGAAKQDVDLPKIEIKVAVKSLTQLSADLQNSLATKKVPIPAGVFQAIIESPTAETIEELTNSNGIEAIEIVRPPVFDPERMVPFNEDARITHHVPEFLAMFSDQSDLGSSMTVAVFDGGKILTTHQEFKDGDNQTRVSVHPTNDSSLSRHATHVAGTIGAKGVELEARGMAENASIVSFDWIDDIINLEAISSEATISNHSYGPNAGWTFNPEFSAWFWWGDTSLSEDEDAKFGKYSSDNRLLDTTLFRKKSLVTFVAAGNDRNDDPGSGTIHFKIGRNPATGGLEWQRSSRTRPGDGDDNGLDTIAGLGLSKNAICIGAIHDITNELDSIRITAFSGFGPSDDFRIKPDLVANGQDLFSCSSAADDAYATLPGTSMACPTASGIGVLLSEQFNEVHGRQPTSAELKAVLIHTADDAGNPGPDPTFGWGAINALSAGKVVAGRDHAEIISGSIKEGEANKFVQKFDSDGTAAPRVTLVWTDLPGPISTSGLDDSSSTLVHDLDVILISPSGTKNKPYRLDPSDVSANALNDAANRTDNVEVVDAPQEAGEWTLEIVGARVNRKLNDLGDVITDPEASQDYSVVVSGLKKN